RVRDPRIRGGIGRILFDRLLEELDRLSNARYRALVPVVAALEVQQVGRAGGGRPRGREGPDGRGDVECAGDRGSDFLLGLAESWIDSFRRAERTAASSADDPRRPPGSFSRQRATAETTGAGIPGDSAARGAGSSRSVAASVSDAEAPRKGDFPESISYRMQ